MTGVRLPDGSRSVESVWVWRAFLLLALIAGGLVIAALTAGDGFYAASWSFITAGWFALSMWLWRQHVRAARSAPAPGKPCRSPARRATP